MTIPTVQRLRNRRGTSTVEYGLLIAVVVVVFAAVMSLQGETADMFSRFLSEVANSGPMFGATKGSAIP